MAENYELRNVNRITVGTVGEPGNRTFYLQVRTDDRALSFKLEKQQVAALSEFLDGLLADLPAPGAIPPMNLELDEPVVPEWAVGPIGVAYDDEDDAVVLEINERETESSGTDTSVVRIRLSREQARLLSTRGNEIVPQGRPPCPECGHPFDATHVCPKKNGHRPPAP